MTNIVATAVLGTAQTLPEKKKTLSFPEPHEIVPVCIYASKEAILERLAGWQSERKGADVMSRAAYTISLKEALENDHPANLKFEVNDTTAMLAEYTRIVNHTEGFSNKCIWRVTFRNSIAYRIKKWFPMFLTADLREYAVRLHARGNSTSNVVKHLLSPASEIPNVFYYLNGLASDFEKHILDWLIPRLAYLKIGASSFPKKYMTLWQEEREAYLDEIKSMPLTETVEQVHALSDLYTRLDDAFNSSETDRGKAQIAASMVKTMSGIYTLTRDPRFIKSITGDRRTDEKD